MKEKLEALISKWVCEMTTNVKEENKRTIPAVAFSAWSGTGKTTIIEQLIRCLKDKGVRVAAIKHDAHDFEIDKEGKDSYRFTQAGAEVTVLASSSRTVFMEQRSMTLEDILSHIENVDLIIAEGYNHEALPRIGISRAATGTGFRLPIDSYIALVTDALPIETNHSSEIPVFALNDTEGLANFLIRHFGLV